MVHEIIIAGFGGQGVLSVGQFLIYAGMLEGLQVSWVPAYGPEMRGGTANCLVTIGREEIDSPVFERATAAIVMNQPSLEKFEAKVRPGGLLLFNSSLVERPVRRTDVQVYEIPANDLAYELGNIKVANMVMLGAFLKVVPVVNVESVLNCLQRVFPAEKHHLIPLNREAMALGARQVNYLLEQQRQAG
ncbi:MAG: 2-oxoacid:acceptor oxidoreductase family protein [Firmicutes bacterium]|nr:2-oxoacid:acceptor oxidoreductase family protein [Bacillota bacterium]